MSTSFLEGRKFAQGMILESCIQDVIEAKIDFDHAEADDKDYEEKDLTKKRVVLARYKDHLKEMGIDGNHLDTRL